jgi:hypothetical protein
MDQYWRKNETTSQERTRRAGSAFQDDQAIQHQAPALKNAFAIPNGGQRHKAVAAKLKAEGVSPGYPDIALDWPSRDYHGLRIELKRDSKRACMSGNQIEWFARLSDAGYLCQCCHGWRNAWATICWYLKINPITS